MKKIVIFVLMVTLVVGLFGFSSAGKEDFEIKQSHQTYPNIYDGFNARGPISFLDSAEGGSDLIHYDVTNHRVVRNLEKLTHPQLGKPSYVDRSFSKKDKIIYRSNWTLLGKPITQQYDYGFSVTYRFPVIFDLPVDTRNVRQVTSSRDIEIIKSFTPGRLLMTEEIIENGIGHCIRSDVLSEMSIGNGINLDTIDLNGSTHLQNKVTVGYQMYNKIQQIKGTKVIFEDQESFNRILSNDLSIPIWVHSNYRQRFIVYLIATYRIVYQENHWTSGIFDWDKHWSYAEDGLIGVQTNFLLIPIGQNYHEYTEYLLSDDGKYIVKNQPQPNVVYYG